LVIVDVDALVPEIRRLADAIERRLSHYVGVNAYLSFSRGSAFKAHWDIHDVLVVQVHGSKRWRSYGTPVPYPHLTIRIRPRRGADFLAWLTKQATDDELFRMDLTRLGGDAALRLHETRLKARLHTLIDSSNLLAYLEANDRERSPRALFSLNQVDLDDDSIVVPAPRRRDSLLHTENKDVSTVTIGGEHYHLSAPARLMLATLLDRNETRFRELVVALSARTSEETLREAVIELVRCGLAALQDREPT
jgi:hypothetical protein